MKKYFYTTVDWLLIISLSVALVCSLLITVEVLYYKNDEYKKTFSSWQLPMLVAMLFDIYLMCK